MILLKCLVISLVLIGLKYTFTFRKAKTHSWACVCCTLTDEVMIYWFSATSALHSGITEEDLRASGVMNPSHIRRILENLPKNWNWLAEVKVVRRPSESWKMREWKKRPVRLQGQRLDFFMWSIDAVTADYPCQHDGGSVLLHSLPYLSLHLERQ